MLRASILGLLLTPVLAACGGDPSDDPGPNDGPNTLEVVVDGAKADLDSVDLDATESSTAAVVLDLRASVDPIKDAIDDEFSYVFRLSLDRAALAARSAPFEVAMQGELQFPSVQIIEHEATWSNAADGDPAVRLAMLRRACFCPEPPAGRQTVSGTLSVEELDADSITGRLDIRVQGDVPNMNGPQDVRLRAELDLALPGA